MSGTVSQRSGRAGSRRSTRGCPPSASVRSRRFRVRPSRCVSSPSSAGCLSRRSSSSRTMGSLARACSARRWSGCATARSRGASRCCCATRRTGSRAATPTRCCCSKSSSAAGIEVVFAKEPERSGTPEDELLRQFQGMIAEYERAQIAERCRRGKLHRARAGAVSVLAQRALRLPVCQEVRARRRVLRDRRARSADRAGGLRPLRRAERVDRADRPGAHRAGRADPDRDAMLGTVDDLGNAAQPGLRRAGRVRQDAQDRHTSPADAPRAPAR